MRVSPGRAAVLLIVVLGVALAAFNVYFRYATTNRIHAQWGTAALLRVAEAPRAEWWDLARADANAQPDATPTGQTVETVVERIALDGRTFAVRRRGDLIGARGFVHLRNALGQNASYDWTREPTGAGAWRWAIAFADDRERTVLLFDDAFRVARTFESPEPVTLTDKMSAGLKTFFAEQTERANQVGHAGGADAR